MIIIIIIFILFFVMINYQNLFAQNNRWKYFSTNDNGDDFYYDELSIQYYDDMVEVWIKTVYKYTELYDHSMCNMIINCKLRKIFLNESYFYKDYEIKRKDPPSKGIVNIIPDSFGELIYENFCINNKAQIIVYCYRNIKVKQNGIIIR